jgi:hypothetical protein
MSAPQHDKPDSFAIFSLVRMTGAADTGNALFIFTRIP